MCEAPPNRPVPIPPPRKPRSPSQSYKNQSRLRPIKTPRNLESNKSDAANLKDIAKDIQESPPPPLPEKVRTGSLANERSSNEQHLNNDYVKTRDSHKNEIDDIGFRLKPKLPNCKSGGSKEIKFKINEPGLHKVIPLPQPRRRSQEKREWETTNSPISGADDPLDGEDGKTIVEQIITSSDDSKNENFRSLRPSQISQLPSKPSLNRRRVSAPEEPERFNSLSDLHSCNQFKAPPPIKPRSKSLANIRSGKVENSKNETILESNLGCVTSHFSLQDCVFLDKVTNADLHGQKKYDENKNMIEAKHLRSPPKPRTRAKHTDRE